jgi:hypothetical protein
MGNRLRAPVLIGKISSLVGFHRFTFLRIAMIYLTHVRSSADQNGVYQVVVRVSNRPFDYFAKKRTFTRQAWNAFIAKVDVMKYDYATKCYRRTSARDLK